MTFEGHLRTAGLLLLLLAALHPLLPRALGWREDLRKLTLVNRQIFLVHVVFIVLLLILFGILTFSFASELAAPSPLARAVLCGLAIFWGLRLATQLFIYDRSLWRGNVRNTTVHVLASLLWLYLTAVFAWGSWR
jgi:hypothetical protein